MHFFKERNYSMLCPLYVFLCLIRLKKCLCITYKTAINRVDNIFLIYSPSGKLVQIEYALAAVAAGAPSVGIKGRALKSYTPVCRCLLVQYRHSSMLCC